MKELEETYYKVVLVLSDGRRVSPWARGSDHYPELEYVEGELVLPPEDSLGIGVYPKEPNLPILQLDRDTKRSQYLGSYNAVHECRAFGEYKGGFVSAIILGKEVSNNKLPEEPKEEWVDVTNECEAKINTGHDNTMWVSLIHGGAERVLLGSKGMHRYNCQDGRVNRADQNYRVVECERDAYPCGGCRILKRQY